MGHGTWLWRSVLCVSLVHALHALALDSNTITSSKEAEPQRPQRPDRSHGDQVERAARRRTCSTAECYTPERGGCSNRAQRRPSSQDRQVDRRVDRQGDRQGDRQVDRQVDRQGDRQGDRQVDRQGDRQLDRQGDRQGDRQVDRQGDRQVDRRVDRQVDRQLDRQGDGFNRTKAPEMASCVRSADCGGGLCCVRYLTGKRCQKIPGEGGACLLLRGPTKLRRNLGRCSCHTGLTCSAIHQGEPGQHKGQGVCLPRPQQGHRKTRHSGKKRRTTETERSC